MDAIAAYELSKQYQKYTALSRLNLQVPEGCAFACVGGKNSGKTTLVRLLSGLIRPTAGECNVMGLSPFFEAEKLHSVVGTVLDSAHLYEGLTLSENLLFFAGINGMDNNDALDRISFLLHRLDIWESRDEKVGDLPTNVARRGSLARALIHRPRLLLVDGPAVGVDGNASVRELLSHLVSQEGMTMLLCTRNMEYVQDLCGSFALLREGTLMAKGGLEELRQGSGVRCRVLVRLKEGETPSGSFHFSDGFWKKDIRSEEELPKIVAQIVGEGKQLYETRLEKPGLEEIYAAYLAGGIQRLGEIDEQDDDGEWEQEPAGEEFPEAAFDGEAVSTADDREQPEDGADGFKSP